MKLVKPTAFFWSCFVFTLIHVTASLLAAERPNIVIIFTDDQQYDTYGANGRSNVQTPVLDRLAKRGVRFTNAHAPFLFAAHHVPRSSPVDTAAPTVCKSSVPNYERGRSPFRRI